MKGKNVDKRIEKYKDNIARLGLWCIALCLAAAVILIPQTEKALASPVNKTAYHKNLTISDADKYIEIDMGKKAKGAKKITVKSSKKSVIKPSAGEKDFYRSAYINVNKTGKATLTIKVKKKSGTKTYKCKVKVVKYKKPVTKFALGARNYAGSYSKGTYGMIRNTAASAKLSVKAAKGWKIKKIKYTASAYNKDSRKYTKISKTLKNNKSVSLKTAAGWSQQIAVTVYNKKQKLTETLTLAVYPNAAAGFTAGVPASFVGMWDCEEEGYLALRISADGDFSLYDTCGNPGISGVMGNDNGSTVTCRFYPGEDFDPPFCWRGKLKNTTDVLQYQSGSKVLRLEHNGAWLTFRK